MTESAHTPHCPPFYRAYKNEYLSFPKKCCLFDHRRKNPFSTRNSIVFRDHCPNCVLQVLQAPDKRSLWLWSCPARSSDCLSRKPCLSHSPCTTRRRLEYPGRSGNVAWCCRIPPWASTGAGGGQIQTQPREVKRCTVGARGMGWGWGHGFGGRGAAPQVYIVQGDQESADEDAISSSFLCLGRPQLRRRTARNRTKLCVDTIAVSSKSGRAVLGFRCVWIDFSRAPQTRTGPVTSVAGSGACRQFFGCIPMCCVVQGRV